MQRSQATLKEKAWRLRARWSEHLPAAKRPLFWCACGSSIVLLCLGLFALSTAPGRDSQRHSRSYSEAGAVSDHLRALRLEQHRIHDLRSAVQKALHPDFSSQLAQEEEEELQDYDPLAKSVESLMAQLLAVEERVPCHWDPTLEPDLHQLEGLKLMIAANFRDNEQLLPHVIVQLWHLLAILPPGSAFVSVYESGSQDSTGAWLEVLSQVLKAMRVRYRIIAGGSLRRADDQDRIDFLAQVRNAALEPLWRPTLEPESRDSGPGGLRARRAKQTWEADKVIFINDVFFCARDAVRLLLHGADMSCGMDFDRKRLGHISEEEQRHHLGQFLHYKLGLPAVVGRMLGEVDSILQRHVQSDSANMFFGRDEPLGFYDIWVNRDSNGALFTKEEPYGNDPYTLERLPQGLPFPVKCCWNGLVVLNAAPFTRHNLRVRAHREGECAASECSLVCNDFIRLGYGNLVLDPGVRQAYTARDARDLYKPEWVRGINVTSWADVSTAPPIDSSLTPFRPFSQCCGLQPGSNIIDFREDCGWENILSPNYTAAPAPVMPAPKAAPGGKGVQAPTAARETGRRRRTRRRKAIVSHVREQQLAESQFS